MDRKFTDSYSNLTKTILGESEFWLLAGSFFTWHNCDEHLGKNNILHLNVYNITDEECREVTGKTKLIKLQIRKDIAYQ